MYSVMCDNLSDVIVFLLRLLLAVCPNMAGVQQAIQLQSQRNACNIEGQHLHDDDIFDNLQEGPGSMLSALLNRPSEQEESERDEEILAASVSGIVHILLFFTPTVLRFQNQFKLCTF